MGSIKTRPVILIITACISPILIMLMLGSLVYFLIDVLYAGDYSGRLLYTFTFYVIGAVLIARIAIEQGYTYAGIYIVGLGGACFVAMMTFVKYPDGAMKALGPIVNLVLMALVWWSANKLTWDCTHFDEGRKASGQGILAATGLDEHSAFAVKPQSVEEVEPQPKKRKQNQSWLERLREHRDSQKAKPHTPGTWVLYFSLAAIPLFALGQSLVAVEDDARRWSAFIEMAVYVGSGLGLLSTTSLMGLHRYLDERSARISATLTISWLGISFGLIVMFLAVAALLPRPHSESSVLSFVKAGSEDRKASKNAMVKGGSSGKGKGTPGDAQKKGDGKNTSRNGEKSSQGEESKSDQSMQDGESNGDQQQSDSKQETPNKSDQPPEDEQQKGEPEDGESEDGKQQDGEPEEGDAEQDSSHSQQFSQAMERIGGFVKWLVWIVVAVAVIVGIVLFILKGLAPFTDWARNLLNWLRGMFDGRERDSQAQGESDSALVEKKVRPKPFADFSNPFQDGTYRSRDVPELVRYTFLAMDAWAWEIDEGRKSGETPNEFATRLSIDHAELETTPNDVVKLLMQCQFSQQPLPKDGLKTLQTCWRTLDRHV